MNKVCYSRRRITRRINGCDLRVNPRTTVSATAPHMRLGNQHAEPLILFGTSRRSPLPPSVIPSARHAEPRALFCHGIAGLPRLDERVFHSLCLAKKTAAFFNSSRSMRSSRFSLRSRDSSSTSLPAPSLYSGVKNEAFWQSSTGSSTKPARSFPILSSSHSETVTSCLAMVTSCLSFVQYPAQRLQERLIGIVHSQVIRIDFGGAGEIVARIAVQSFERSLIIQRCIDGA